MISSLHNVAPAAIETREIASRGFNSNTEFLDAMEKRFLTLLDRAELRRCVERQHRKELRIDKMSLAEMKEELHAGDEIDGQAPFEVCCALYEQYTQDVDQRLKFTALGLLPFHSLVAEFNLDENEQDILWLAFFKAVSPRIRERFSAMHLLWDRFEGPHELSVGNILDLLWPNSLSEQMMARRYFSTRAPLFLHRLMTMSETRSHASILDTPVSVARRIINWISGDENIYASTGSYIVEYPTETLDHVILTEGTKERVLALVENHNKLAEQQAALGLDDCISYGRGLVILEYGPPGTGKTFFARALANHLKRPLVTLRSGFSRNPRYRLSEQGDDPDLRALFREAKLVNGIVFLDECEIFGSEDYEDMPVLLDELEKTGAIVIMVTNWPERLVPAIDRRCAIKLKFEFPDTRARRKIWEVLKPAGASFADDVKVDRLAVSYPLAGGYIKNAMLDALRSAINRNPAGPLVITQEDLETGARLQEQHLGGASSMRRIIRPKRTFENCHLNPEEVQQLRQIAHALGNYRDLESKWFASNRNGLKPSFGPKILIKSYSLASALAACEALASALEVNQAMVKLETLVTPYFGNRGNTRDAEDPFSILESKDTGTHLLVITDDTGLLQHLGEGKDARRDGQFVHKLKQYEGIAVIATGSPDFPCRRQPMDFHFHLTLHRPDQSIREALWSEMLHTGIPFAARLDAGFLATRYDLDSEELQQLIRHAVLEVAARDREEEVNLEVLDRAYGKMANCSVLGRLLFGE